ncbi:MAG TPA: LiaF-related protein [Candidatus Dojkabacteria bacterium]|nr:LiaF-related protein [Candidatus Dojkabacteria bacterium]HRP51837.1 LiaF-related protein [Candidatus Dojkabacteria bacterium]
MTTEVNEVKVKSHKEKEVKFKGDADKYSGAVFLIIIGTIFLLNTTGALSWSVWLLLLRFWPVFIIIAGIQIILGKTRFGAISIGVIALVIYTVIAIFAIISTGLTIRGNNVIRPAWRERVNNVLLKDPGDLKSSEDSFELVEEEVDEIDLDLNVGLGKFSLSDNSDSSEVVFNSKYFENMGEPDYSSEIDDRTLELDFSQKDNFEIWGFKSRGPEYTLQLPDVKPVRKLDLNLGAGEGEVSFTKLILEELNLEVGAGKLEVELGEDSIPKNPVKVEVGTGDLTIYVPRGTEYKVKYDVGVGEARIFGEEFSGLGKEGEVVSDDYEDTEVRLELDVNVGVGKFEIKYY